MTAPKRANLKRHKIRSFVFITAILLCTILLALFSLNRLEFFDRWISASPLSPIPLNVRFGNPKDQLASDLKRIGLSYEEIYQASNSSYIVKQKDGGEIYMTSGKDIRLQVATLQLILSRLTIEGKSFKRLDLRFDKPVITIK